VQELASGEVAAAGDVAMTMVVGENGPDPVAINAAAAVGETKVDRGS